MIQGKCNLLKPVDCATGTFFMFSQTAQDLTREFTQPDAYRVVPSKMVALDLNLAQISFGDDSRTEQTLGQVFQNYFENACTHIRSAMGEEWHPDYSLPIFWKTLEKYGLIDIKSQTTEEAVSYYYSEDVKFIGDINIYSYNPTDDGIGYSDIYCYIPNDAYDAKFPMHYIPQPPRASFVIDPEDSLNIHGYRGDATATYTGLHWMLDDPNVNLYYYDKTGTEEGTKYYTLDGCVPDILNYIDENITESARDKVFDYATISDSFKFNAVLVTYDVVSKANDEEDDRIIYHNVPMGIYFTGKPSGSKLTNEVTKFRSNPDIYEQGTAYGLRICSRFLCSPNLTKFESVEAEHVDDANAMFTEALSKMAENMDSFNKLSKEIHDMSYELTTHLANFRNNKVNVPYLRNLSGTYYWFVNGKNTGVAANSITKEEVNDLISRMDKIEHNLEETILQAIQQMSLGFSEMPSTTIQDGIETFANILDGVHE